MFKPPKWSYFSSIFVIFKTRVDPGRIIKLTFCEPSSRRTMELIGEIAWSDSDAIGVRLERL